MVGNIPNYSAIDVLRCFLRLNEPIGRQELSSNLELGEGTIRTILKDLKSKKFLDSTRNGHFLSSKGLGEIGAIYGSISKPRQINVQGLYPKYRKVGIRLIKQQGIWDFYRLRDIAVKNGAEGAVILKFDGKLYTPKYGKSQDYKSIEKEFDFGDGDAFIIAFSDKLKSAEIGALSIAIEIVPELKRFIKEAICR